MYYYRVWHRPAQPFLSPA